jgi:TP901 family phage tail tape measure protein
MSLKIDRVELEIVIKNDSNRKQLRQLEDDMRNIRKEMRKLPKESEEWTKKKAELEQLHQKYDAIYEKIGLTGLSLKELKKRQQELNSIIGHLPGDSPLLDKYKKQATEVSARIRELNGNAKQTGLSLSSMANGFNKYFTMGTAAIATVTGLSFALRKVRDSAAEFDEAYADVMKTTQMSGDEVHTLNEELKKIDTRTSREELNKIAEEGGRIGIAKEDILGFTKAMDVANVALGDSFPSVDEIASKLGKLKQLFGETKEMEVEKAYLSIGSAINDLGANGNATEENIADFTTRMGSLPDAIKPSIADTLALGAAFEESGIESEVSSRAYNIFMKQAATNADKFGKVMGKSRQEVEDLINANPLEFFLQFSESMKGMNATETAKTLEALGVNADGANKAIGAAANNTARFRELINLSNKSFKDGTSVLNEFNIKNQTMNALKEKAIKSFKDETEALGKQLNPIFLQSTNLATLFIRILVKLPAIIKDNWQWIVALTFAVSAYAISVSKATIAAKADVAWKKIQELWTNRVAIAQKMLNFALKDNPIGLIVTLISLLVAGFITWYNHSVKVQAVTQGLFASIKALAKNLVGFWTGVWKVISGAATLDPKRMKEGVDAMKDAFMSFGDDVATAYQKAYEERMKKWKSDQKNPKPTTPQKPRSPITPVITPDDSTTGTPLQAPSTTNSAEKKKVDNTLTELDTKNLEAISKIKERFRDNEISSEVEYNRLLLEQQDAFDADRKKKLKELLKTISDPALKTDLLNQIAEIDKAVLDRQIEQNAKIKKIILEADPRRAEEQEYENRLRETGLFGIKKEQMTAEQLEAFKLLEEQHREKMRKLSSKDAALALDQLETDQAKAEALLADRRVKERMSDSQFKDEQLALELEFLRKRLLIQGLSAEQVETITKQIQEKQNEIMLKGVDSRESILQKYGLDTLKSQKESELSLIQYYEDKGIITHEEALKVKKKLSDEHFRALLEKTSEYFDAAGNVASQASGAINGLQDAEISSVDLKYEKMIRAAKKSGQDTTQLEEQKESEQAKIRAKYADANFVVTVAQIIAQTAKAAMDSYTSMAAIPVVGPALGAAAAAAAVVYGASQIKSAKSARDAAKSGYRVGGYTKKSSSDDVEDGPVHSNEFVNNADGVRNPNVRQFLDVFDMAQKNGTIRMLNTTQILEKVRLTGGSRRAGGFGSRVSATASSNTTTDASDTMTVVMDMMEKHAAMYSKLMDRLDVPLQAESVISGSHGSYKKTKDYEKILANASR